MQISYVIVVAKKMHIRSAACAYIYTNRVRTFSVGVAHRNAGMDKILHRLEDMQSARRTQPAGRPERKPSANKSQTDKSQTAKSQTAKSQTDKSQTARPVERNRVPEAPVASEVSRPRGADDDLLDIEKTPQTKPHYQKLIESTNRRDLKVGNLAVRHILDLLRQEGLPITITLVGPGFGSLRSHLAVSWQSDTGEEVVFMKAWVTITQSLLISALFPSMPFFESALAKVFTNSPYGTYEVFTYEERMKLTPPGYFAMFAAGLLLQFDPNDGKLFAQLEAPDYNGTTQQWQYYRDFDGEFALHFPMMQQSDDAMAFARKHFPSNKLMGPWNAKFLNSVTDVHQLLDSYRNEEFNKLVCLEPGDSAERWYKSLLDANTPYDAPSACMKVLHELRIREIPITLEVQASRQSKINNLLVSCKPSEDFENMTFIKATDLDIKMSLLSVLFPLLPYGTDTCVRLFEDSEVGTRIGPLTMNTMAEMKPIRYFELFDAGLSLTFTPGVIFNPILCKLSASLHAHKKDYEYCDDFSEQMSSHFPRLMCDTECDMDTVMKHLETNFTHTQTFGPWKYEILANVTTMTELCEPTFDARSALVRVQAQFHNVSIRPGHAELLLFVHEDGGEVDVATVGCEMFCLIFSEMYTFFQGREIRPKELMHKLMQLTTAHDAPELDNKTFEELSRMDLFSYLAATEMRVKITKHDEGGDEFFDHLYVHCCPSDRDNVIDPTACLRVLRSLQPRDIEKVIKICFPKILVKQFSDMSSWSRALFMGTRDGTTIGPKSADEIRDMTAVDYLDEFNARLRLCWNVPGGYFSAEILWRNETYGETEDLGQIEFESFFPRVEIENWTDVKKSLGHAGACYGPWSASQLRQIKTVEDVIATTEAIAEVKQTADKKLRKKLNRFVKAMSTKRYESVIQGINIERPKKIEPPSWMPFGDVEYSWLDNPVHARSKYSRTLRLLLAAFVIQTEDQTPVCRAHKFRVLERSYTDHEFALSSRFSSPKFWEEPRIRSREVVRYSTFIRAVGHYAYVTGRHIGDWDDMEQLVPAMEILNLDTMNGLLRTAGSKLEIVHTGDKYTVA